MVVEILREKKSLKPEKYNFFSFLIRKKNSFFQRAFKALPVSGAITQVIAAVRDRDYLLGTLSPGIHACL